MYLIDVHKSTSILLKKMCVPILQVTVTSLCSEQDNAWGEKLLMTSFIVREAGGWSERVRDRARERDSKLTKRHQSSPCNV